MSYKAPVDHVFLYHAYALALGGWVRDKEKRFTPIESLAPSVLSIAGGFGSAMASNRNVSVRGKYPFGQAGPNEFYIYVGHAYTEVRGVETDEENAFGSYKTTVRSILNDVRINDVLSVEHAEAVLTSVHDKPGRDMKPGEARVVVGDSNLAGVRVAGKSVALTPHPNVDKVPQFGMLRDQVKKHLQAAAVAGKGGAAADPWIEEMCDWSNPKEIPEGAPDYVRDIATMAQQAHSHFRYSLYRSADVARTSGVRTFKSSVEVDDFGRIFFGEVFASHGTKQVTMFRLDLGCDNCGGVGGSGGSTNGSTWP